MKYFLNENKNTYLRIVIDFSKVRTAKRNVALLVSQIKKQSFEIIENIDTIDISDVGDVFYCTIVDECIKR